MISVILPFYNANQTLERAVKSILDQSYSNFEVILVDNSSTDGSAETARRLATTDSRIRIIDEPRKGVVFAANTGMKAAKGIYIARMDADDVAHPEKLERQFKHLESKPDISISATQVNFQSDTTLNSEFSHFVDWSNGLSTWDDVYTNRFVEFPVVNPTLMFRKTMLENVGYLKEGDFPEDYEWFLRVIEQGYKVEKLEHPLLDWHDSHNRLTRSDSRYRTDAFFQIKTEYLARHLKDINQKKVWIWGAGKLGILRSQMLLNYGIEIEGYVDIKKDKQVSGYPCVHFEEISLERQPFILSYVSNRGQRDEIRNFLNSREYKECGSYIVAG